MEVRVGWLHETPDALLKTSDKRSRSLTEDETALIASNTSEFEQLRTDIERRESIEAQGDHLSMSKGRRTEPTGPRITTDAGTLDITPDATEARTPVHAQPASMRANARRERLGDQRRERWPR